jgi:hypothetical protein
MIQARLAAFVVSAVVAADYCPANVTLLSMLRTVKGGYTGSSTNPGQQIQNEKNTDAGYWQVGPVGGGETYGNQASDIEPWGATFNGGGSGFFGGGSGDRYGISTLTLDFAVGSSQQYSLAGVDSLPTGFVYQYSIHRSEEPRYQHDNCESSQRATRHVSGLAFQLQRHIGPWELRAFP